MENIDTSDAQLLYITVLGCVDEITSTCISVRFKLHEHLTVMAYLYYVHL